MQAIYLDISNKGVVPTIYAKQGDVGRKFEVIFTNSGLPYVPPDGSVFSVWYSGSSGEGNYTDIDDRSAFSVNENKVAVEMISQMLTNDGNGVLCLVLNESNGNQIGSWNIPYICEPVPGIDSEEAKSYYTAFSNAVKDLPYPDASLSAPGKAADAAATGLALEGKAPAGYGLGERAFNAPGNDANQITKCGFFRAHVNTPTGDWWTIQQEDLYGDGTYMIQKASCFAYAFVLHAERMVVDGKFYEWEWVNPPMMLGVEYRTAERYEGKPVYAYHGTYALESTLSGNTRIEIHTGISNLDVCIRKEAKLGYYFIPYIDATSTTTIEGVSQSGILFLANSGTASWNAGFELDYTLYYTKTTD